MSDESVEHGRLFSAVRRKKLIDKWTFASPVHKGKQETLTADVYMKNRSGKAPKFYAFSNQLPGSWFDDTDIKKLFRRVEEQFRLADLARHGLAWEDWIELEIGGYVFNNESENKAALDINYSIIKRALDHKTGKHLTIHHSNNCIVPFPSPKKAGEEDPDNDDSKFSGRDIDTQYAYIPATPANLAAVKALLERLRVLRAGLNGLLHQEVIENTLKNARLLPFKESRQ